MGTDKTSVRAGSNSAQRITELENQVKELERLNRTMVGRELKMLELKKEIKILKQQVRFGQSH